MSQILPVKKCVAVLTAVLIALLLAGCYDQREIDDQAYPMALGLDIGQKNKLRMTLQLAAPLSIGSGGGGESIGVKGGKGGETTSIITVDTPSIYSGFNLINNIISKEINMAHTKVVVISKRLAEEGVTKYLRALQRGREFRPNMYVLVSRNPPDEYLRKVKPTLESNPAKYYELILGKKFSAFYPRVKIHDFYMQIKSDAVEPVAVFTGLSKYESTDQLKNTGENDNEGAHKHEGYYVAGDIPIVADQKNEIMGLAVFKEGKMVGILDGTESSCHQMIVGDYNYSYWTLQDPYAEDNIVVMNIFQRKKPIIMVELNDGKANIHITLDLEGDFVSIQSGFDYEKNPEIIEQKTAEVIKENVMSFLNKTKNEFNSDICGFGNYVRKKFLTWDQWEKFSWLERYKYTTFNVDVKFKIRRTGLMIRTVH